MLAVDLAKKFPGVDSLILPVEFARSFDVLKNHLRQHVYDCVISLGQAAGRSKVSFEKIGLNWVQTEHQDESGHKPSTGAIFEQGPLAVMSRFPVDDVYQALKAKKYPVEVSFSAGTFVCNDFYFRTLTEFANLKPVFIHVPLITEQGGEGKVSLEYQTLLNVFNDLVEILMSTPI